MINSVSLFAFVVAAPGVEGRQDAFMAYTTQYDILQNQKEIQKLLNMAEELSKLQTQINNFIELNKTALDTLKKTEHMVAEHGDWKDVTYGDLFDTIDRKSDQNANTTQSIIDSISSDPEQVLEKKSILNSYYNKVDTKNWNQEQKSPMEKYILKMATAEKFKAYEEYRIQLHGYKNTKTGEDSGGDLKKLEKSFTDAKGDLAKAKTDVAVKAASLQLNKIQEEIDDKKKTEEILRRDYETSLEANAHSKSVEDQVLDNKSELIHEKILADETVRTPSTETVYGYLRKQEQEAVN